MEKRIFLPVLAAMALTGQIHASAPILNAASRFMLTGSGVAGASLYAAHNYPTAFQHVTSAFSHSAKNASVSADSIISEVIKRMPAQQMPQQPIFNVNTGGGIPTTKLAIGGVVATLIAGFIYDYYRGSGLTQWLVRQVDEKLVKGLKKAFLKILHIERGVKKINGKIDSNSRSFDDLKQSQSEQGEKIEAIQVMVTDTNKKVTAVIEMQRPENKEQKAQIAEKVLKESAQASEVRKDQEQEKARKAQEQEKARKAQEQEDARKAQEEEDNKLIEEEMGEMTEALCPSDKPQIKGGVFGLAWNAARSYFQF